MRGQAIALVLVLLATVIPLLAIFAYQAVQKNDYTLELLARREELGNWLPRRIELTAGDRVRILVRNVDIISHGIRIPAFGIEDLVLPAGQAKVIEFTADKVGTFPFSCTVPCSPEHMEMRGTITVISKRP